MNRHLAQDTEQRAQRDALSDAAHLLDQVAAAVARNPTLDPQTVRHTLALLQLDPLARLNRSLLRGRPAVHRT
jgi:hypothetical protein